ncbi:MAG: small multi-drug export protein [bacterium]
MHDFLVDWFGDMHPLLAVFLISMLPVSELRGSIIFGHSLTDAGALPIYLAAVAGNFVPVLPLLLLLRPIENHLRRFGWIDRFLDWLFRRTVSRSGLIRKYQSIGLILFVAIPAPMTGAWTGSIAAYLFKLPLRMALPCIILGICLAGLVMTLAMMGVIQLWSLT